MMNDTMMKIKQVIVDGNIVYVYFFKKDGGCIAKDVVEIKFIRMDTKTAIHVDGSYVKEFSDVTHEMSTQECVIYAEKIKHEDLEDDVDKINNPTLYGVIDSIPRKVKIDMNIREFDKGNMLITILPYAKNFRISKDLSTEEMIEQTVVLIYMSRLKK